ncbi:hypothetical protein, partial [Methylobacterium soli]
MLAVAIGSNHRLKGGRHAVVIRDRSGHQIATATGTPNGQDQNNQAAPHVVELPLVMQNRALTESTAYERNTSTYHSA